MRVIFLAIFALVGGCLPHAGSVQAPNATPTALAAVLTRTQTEGGPSVTAIPDAAEHRLEAVLAAHNLNAVSVPGAVDAFSVRRTTPLRLSWLSTASTEAPITVLVEAEARFFSPLGGQYRWTVAVSASVVSRGGEPATDSFEVPVFLSYDHEAEPEALEDAMPVIERHLGALLDNTLRGLGAGTKG